MSESATQACHKKQTTQEQMTKKNTKSLLSSNIYIYLSKSTENLSHQSTVRTAQMLSTGGRGRKHVA